MCNFKPRSCGPLGWSDISNTYVEDKDSGGFFVLNARSFSLSMPLRFGDDANNERLLMSLVVEAIEWMSILRSDSSNQWPMSDTIGQSDRASTTNYIPGSYSHRTHLMLIQDEISEGMVVINSTSLTITMPIVSEDDLYFVNEHRLMRLASDGLEMIDSQRTQREIDEQKSREVEMSATTVLG